MARPAPCLCPQACLAPLSIAGKVAIQKEDLQKYHNRDTWFQLQHVDADSEVQVRLGACRSSRERAKRATLVYAPCVLSLR